MMFANFLPCKAPSFSHICLLLFSHTQTTHSLSLSLLLKPSKAQTQTLTLTLAFTQEINNGIWGRQFPQGASQKLRCACWVCFFFFSFSLFLLSQITHSPKCASFFSFFSTDMLCYLFLFLLQACH